MELYLSPAAQRAVESARCWAARLDCPHMEPLHLLLAILEQRETRGASLLSAHGVELPDVLDALSVAIRGDLTEIPVTTPLAAGVARIMNSVRAKHSARNPAGTDALLLELLVHDEATQSILGQAVADMPALLRELRDEESNQQPLAAAFGRLRLDDPLETQRYRILDAAANRVREGLRVIEDFLRFACDDTVLTADLKSLRHDLKLALEALPYPRCLAARDTTHDVGTTISTASEYKRPDLLSVLSANLKRVQESLRSLEEYAKIDSSYVAEQCQALRYRLYSFEQVLLNRLEAKGRLAGIRLYLLATSLHAPAGIEWTITQAIRGGVQAVQLREKSLPDRELIHLARRVRQITRSAGAVFIVNDRPDIARIAQADGVHLGQEELSVKDARTILGPDALVGVSIHDTHQLSQAIRDGADYVGVGPVFPSKTKSFARLAGVDLVRETAALSDVPAFAIGGIDISNLHHVLAAGAERIAVGAAICAADDPEAAARELIALLGSLDSATPPADSPHPTQRS